MKNNMSLTPIEKLDILNSKIVYKDGTVITMIPDVLQKINELIEVVNEQSEKIIEHEDVLKRLLDCLNEFIGNSNHNFEMIKKVL